MNAAAHSIRSPRGSELASRACRPISSAPIAVCAGLAAVAAICAHRLRARLAEVDGTVVGLTHYLFHRSTIMLGPTCYLQDLFTDQAVRGRGVGRALIAAVCDEARAAGSTRVYWQTHETNATARALYDRVAERTGFIVYRIQLD
ncbi:MAG TPA: GNAT family N-acetyltransferase [Kofleriaceae bacterium]|nr:GNAT family N-acetyltransferase [Kofleriaceae bacterium]